MLLEQCNSRQLVFEMKRKGMKLWRVTLLVVIIMFIILAIIFQNENAGNVVKMDWKRRLINFVDSSDNKVAFITPRQACAFESAARSNRKFVIKIHFTDEKRYLHMINSSPTLSMLMTHYPNIEISYFDLVNASIGSPAEEFVRAKKLSDSMYIVENTSNLARLLIMWKYSGAYLDSDVIVQKSLQYHPGNFIYREGEWFANAMMRLDKKEIAENAIEYFVKNFSPIHYGHNGPKAMTRTITLLCNMTTTDVDVIMRKGSCQELYFLSPWDCCEISFNERHKFFETKYSDEVMMRTKNSSIVHFSNHFSKKISINKTSGAAYIRMAKMHCPLTLQQTANFF